MQEEIARTITDEQLKLLAREIVLELRQMAHIRDDELVCLTVAEAAELLGHHVSEVRKLIRTKKLKAFHSGTSVKIRKIKLLEYIEKQEEEEYYNG